MNIFWALLMASSGGQTLPPGITCPSARISGTPPPVGMVANREDALQIAEIILNRIYGRAIIRDEKPFHLTDRGDKFVISGTVRRPGPGGVASIVICKANGQTVFVTHTK